MLETVFLTPDLKITSKGVLINYHDMADVAISEPVDEPNACTPALTPGLHWNGQIAFDDLPKPKQHQWAGEKNWRPRFKKSKIFLGAAGCCCCCCLLVVVVRRDPLVWIAARKTDERMREIDPENIDFGPSYWDQFCNWTFRPDTVSRNRSFVSSGLPVALGSYQYLALLIGTNNGVSLTTCTASLLDHRHLLTAAHCVTNKTRGSAGLVSSNFIEISAVRHIRLGVVVGLATAADPQARHLFNASAEAVYIHPNFDEVGWDYVDVAVIRTKETIPFNDYIQPVCLASAADEKSESCVAVGYGVKEKDSNDRSVLYRAPDINVYSSMQCKKGSLRAHIEQLLEPFFKAASNQELKAYVESHYSGKLCSLLDASNGQGVCSGDSGGPLMCTPVGTPRSAEYQDPKSPLFNKTDPSLKQFGITMSQIKGRECGEEGLVTIFTSVRHYRLWLEYVVLPIMNNTQAAKEKEQQQVTSCMLTTDWKDMATLMRKTTNEVLSSSEKQHVCRMLHTYLTCVENSLKASYCDHLDVTKLHGVGKNQETVDFLSLFHKERCRQLNVCRGGSPPACAPILLLVAVCAWHGFFYGGP